VGTLGTSLINQQLTAFPVLGRLLGTGNWTGLRGELRRPPLLSQFATAVQTIVILDSPVCRMIIGEPVATNPVYLEIIDFFASGTTPQAVVDFQPSPAAQHRALELLDLAKEDRLTPEQESELEHFTELEHILRMAKARARQILDAKQ
jgi:hypothetical protein